MMYVLLFCSDPLIESQVFCSNNVTFPYFAINDKKSKYIYTIHRHCFPNKENVECAVQKSISSFGGA